MQLSESGTEERGRPTPLIQKPATVSDLKTISSSSIHASGPGSAVGIATGYGLDGPEIESRWG